MNIESFRGSAGPSLGVELEFQIVDAESLALTGAADKVIESIPESAPEFIGPEFFRCCVEINTGVCRDVDEVDRDLSATISATNAAARQHGVLLAWGGTHPFSHWRDQPVVPDPRYLELAGHYGETLCRQLTFGMHVHVGVPDGDAAVHVSNRMSEHLPALLAISANSPFWCGRATGLHSHRVEVMNASPTGGLPRPWRTGTSIRAWSRSCRPSGSSTRPRICGGTYARARRTERSRCACATCRTT